MSTKILQDRLDTYNAQTSWEEEIALKEILQEIILAALGRTDFFKYAAFQGGTALRILYSLERFSEDLDFILQQEEKSFAITSYLQAIQLECTSYGMSLEFQDRSKADQAVKKAFLKDNSLGKILHIKHPSISSPSTPKKLRIKLEIDTNPPAGSHTEIKYLNFPFASAVTMQNLPSLFAGKSHALLCREYVKGRDWYDFLWYVVRKTSLNFEFLTQACRQQGPWKHQTMVITQEWYLHEMKKKIESINWQEAQQDVMPFLRAHHLKSLELWSTDFFLDALQKLEQILSEKSVS
ncbi:MAG: hypothetical protein A3I05_01805 [Deltaproteobacteria bacterium RIFCSPLOWO2_02_FULL_44_10]|nr:MAG: hypothetical protein A3C46_04905 [Deltaproteobacteria bacterium RIFCSPHIGHO2_02_FULL_44_16]OGQ44945.1 MAG: hypothetical protein A3I05_01805 [Deltaproteobacteria bacterium RIFCSPLOWO2_02_FULL_44_10]